jgi:hypothetical protein
VTKWCEIVYVGAGLQALLQYASQLSATQARNTLQVGGVVWLRDGWLMWHHVWHSGESLGIVVIGGVVLCAGAQHIRWVLYARHPVFEVSAFSAVVLC